MRRGPLLLSLIAVALAEEDEHAGHNHGEAGEEKPYEWAGIFPTPEDYYLWTAQSAEGGSYADPSMTMVVLAASDDAEATLSSLAHEAEDGFGHTPCKEVEAGETIMPAEHTCYHLHFDIQVWQTLFKINATGASHLAIFAQHFPTEFERDAHYLKDDHGDDIEPTHEIPEAAAEPNFDLPWGEAIGASFLVMFCTLIGVIFVIPIFAQCGKKHQDSVMGLSNAFAAGALLAAAFYLMLYEATHLIVRDEESFATAEWGSMILTGYITATVLDLFVNMLVGQIGGGGASSTMKKAVETASAEEAPKSPPPSPPAEGMPVVEGVDPSHRRRVLVGVLLGDFVHNLVDGLVIGTAFSDRHCYKTMAWTITAATIYHELAQEISDYFVLTNPNQGNLKPPVALLLNFLSGFSVLFGVIATMSTELSMYSQGMLLAFGGGVYVQIGATECMPRVYEYAKSTRMRLLALGFFTFGALAIGLVLLDHEHCAPGGGEDGADPHAGHNHGRL